MSLLLRRTLLNHGSTLKAVRTLCTGVSRVDVDYWAQEAEKLHWFKKWDVTLDNSNPPFTKW